MSMFRGFDSTSSSGAVSGGDSGVYGGIMAGLVNGGVGRVQYRPQLNGIMLDPAGLLAKRAIPADFEVLGRERKQQKQWVSESPAAEQQICEASVKNRLLELEKALLDEDDEGGSGLEATVEIDPDWKDAVFGLVPGGTAVSSTSSSSTVTSLSPSPQSTCSPAGPEPKQVLTDAVVGFMESRPDNAARNLSKLHQLCSMRSGDPENRLLAYIAKAFAPRSGALTEFRPLTAVEIGSPNNLATAQMLYEASPCFKLAFLAANLAVVDAAGNRQRLHIIDFDAGQGNQYMSLIQALVDRKKSGRPHPNSLKITTVFLHGETSNNVSAVGERLEKLADRAGIQLKFSIVEAKRISELDKTKLGCEDEEAVAVNFAFRLYRVPDESVSTENPRDELLRLARSLNPVTVTLAEQELNCNTAPFRKRLSEVLGYYRPLLESLDTTISGEEKIRVEEWIGKRAANAVACEGRDRLERCEVAGKWHMRLEMAGFRQRPLPGQVQVTVGAKLKSYRRGQTTSGFVVNQAEGGGLALGWHDRVLTHLSAWH